MHLRSPEAFIANKRTFESINTCFYYPYVNPVLKQIVRKRLQTLCSVAADDLRRGSERRKKQLMVKYSVNSRHVVFVHNYELRVS